MRIAFFDMDGTILSVNSAKLWLRRERRERHISAGVAVRGLFWAGLYSAGFANLDDVLEDAAGIMAGVRERDIIDRNARFWHDEVRATIRPGARRAVARHRAAGDRLVVLTSSTRYLAELVAHELGFDDCVTSVLQVKRGIFTGKAELPLCFRAGKVARAKAFADACGASLDDAFFYSDSVSDAPMLEAAGKPVVVHPDRPLRKLAHERGWPIERWS